MAFTGSIQRDNGDKAAERKWCDLPRDILASIAGGLGIIDLISFRSVCKDWNSASVTASAEIESSQFKEPWFLLYGEEGNSQCFLLSKSDKKYTINIPELNGATCIASNRGWLLLIQHEDHSIYFFCPFSRAKIDLPKLPSNSASVSNYLATFPSPPTSEDCFVSIICRDEKSSPQNIELYVVHRGDKEWTTHTYSHEYLGDVEKIKCVAYYDEKLNITDAREKRLLTYSFQNSTWKWYTLVTSSAPNVPSLKFSLASHFFEIKDMKKRLGLDGNVSLSICGAVFALLVDEVIFDETIDATDTQGSQHRSLKGVWIHPRLFILPPNQTW